MRHLTWFEMLDAFYFNRNTTDNELCLLWHVRGDSPVTLSNLSIKEFLDYFNSHPVARLYLIGLPVSLFYDRAIIPVREFVAFLVWFLSAEIALFLPMERFIPDGELESLANYIADGYFAHSYRLARLQGIYLGLKVFVNNLFTR